jgi:FtsP/CotA-like multicopper oxidase with cupredoxin domain
MGYRQALPRRSFLRAGVATAFASATMRARAVRAADARKIQLVAGPARVPLLGRSTPDTEVWAYDGSVPGPLLRFRQGETVRIAVENRLAEGTTVHWHGVRVPNAMDGVPFLTQQPIAPGETFHYEFTPPDAGTYWYHPHQRSLEQVGHGLYGAFIVDEPAPIAVDRDLIWVLGDWRLGRDASINDDFGNHMDVMMGGHIGTTVTINGSLPSSVPVRAGERLRLRLINAAPARIFALEFGGHRPRIIALDGQPVEPHEPEGGRIVLGPAMRVDVVLDMTGRPGERFPVNDDFYARFAYQLVDLAYADAPMRDHPLEADLRLPANPLPEPDLSAAERHEIVLGGGMMMGEGMMGGGGMMGGDMAQGMMGGAMWTINGVAAMGHVHEPLLFLKRGRSYLFAIRNETAFHHPIHLHGHSFRVIARNSRPTHYREWQDTVLVPPRESADIAFVADNPGDWMIHCHILDHQESGMMATVRVS